MATKQRLMKQPHNVTDSVAYAAGNILEELQTEQRSGRIGKALKYYKMVSEGRSKAMVEVQDEEKEEARKQREKDDGVFEEMKRCRLEEAAKRKKGLGRAARDRMMARTTFNAKALHSAKHLEAAKLKAAKDAKNSKKQSSSRGGSDDDADADADAGGKKAERQKKKKEKEKRKKLAKKSGKKGSKKKKVKVGAEEDVVGGQLKSDLASFEPTAGGKKTAAVIPAAAANSDDDGAGHDSDASASPAKIVSLAQQQRTYQARLASDAAAMEAAQRESVEKENELKEVAAKMLDAKNKKEEIAKFGKSKRARLEVRSEGQKREEAEEAAAAAGELQERPESEPAAKGALVPLKLKPLKLPGFLGGQKSKNQKTEKDEEEEKKKKKKKKNGGLLSSDVVDLEAGKGGETTAETTADDRDQPAKGEDGVDLLPPPSDLAPPPPLSPLSLLPPPVEPPVEPKVSLIFQFGSLLYTAISYLFWVVEFPLMLPPIKYKVFGRTFTLNPYKKWKMSRVAKRLFREAHAAEEGEAAGSAGCFGYGGSGLKENPVKFLCILFSSFMAQQAARVHVVGLSIYIHVSKRYNDTGRIYTVEDLEGGAYDGDNGLVVRCFAQNLLLNVMKKGGVKMLKKGGVKMEVEGLTPDGKTPLMCCFEGLLLADEAEAARRLEVKKSEEEAPPAARGMQGMLSMGAKATAKAISGPKDPASKYNKTIATLLSMGANINTRQDVRSSEGQGLLHLAAKAGNTKRLVWLLAKGCPVDEVAQLRRQTALHYACAAGRSEVALVLLSKGCAINKRDKYGKTPLHLAAESGGTHMVRVMMLSGARKDLWDDEGMTAFDVAKRHGKRASVEALLVYSATTMGAKHSINFLFHKMLAEGEHKAKSEGEGGGKYVWGRGGGGEEEGTGGFAKRGGLALMKWGANMVRMGARIADNSASAADDEADDERKAEGSEAGEAEVGGKEEESGGSAAGTAGAFEEAHGEEGEMKGEELV